MAGASQDVVELVDQNRLVQCLIELRQSGADPFKVEMVVDLEDPLDVGDIARASGDHLHDND